MSQVHIEVIIIRSSLGIGNAMVEICDVDTFVKAFFSTLKAWKLGYYYLGTVQVD